MASSDRIRDRSPLDRKRRLGGSKSSSRRAPPEKRVFVSNIPFDMKWQEVKDLFQEHVGEVTYVELFNDENDKPRGCGILDMGSKDLAKKAIDKMHRFDIKGRKLVVKEDFDVERDKTGRIIKGSGGHTVSSDRDLRERLGERAPPTAAVGNTYGLSEQFLESLGIDGPLHTRIFVANLSYTVDERKLREVFRLAGRVVLVELSRDKDGKSRGHAIIEYDHPVEAVQAISMFNNQSLYDRKMNVRLDKVPGMNPDELSQLPDRLPEGLADVGMGLGSNGNPLTDVAKNLAAQTSANSTSAVNPVASGNKTGLDATALASLLAGASQNPLGDLPPALTGLLLLAKQMGGGGGSVSQSAVNNTLAAALAGSMANTGATGLNTALASLSAVPNVQGGNGVNVGSGGLSSTMTNNSGVGNMPSTLVHQSQVPGLGSLGSSSMGLGPSLGMGQSGDNIGRYQSSTRGGYGGQLMMGSADRQESSMSGLMSAGQARGSDAIMVKNLPLDCSWQDLRLLFSQCGDVKYAEMKDRGIGFVRFSSERDAERAVALMHNTTKGGRVIDVRLY